jgi:antirestriction protein
MKIKYLSLFLVFLIPSLFAEDCSYLQDPKQSVVTADYVGSFNNTFPYELCLLNNPIHEEAIKYIQSIRDMKGKGVREVVTEVGNMFCRGFFGKCNQESFDYKFKESCKKARIKAGEKLGSEKLNANVSNEFIGYSYESCPELAETYIIAYKETAMDEVARYHGKMIEESSEKYLTPSHDKMQKLTNTWDTFVKIFGDISRSLQ